MSSRIRGAEKEIKVDRSKQSRETSKVDGREKLEWRMNSGQRSKDKPLIKAKVSLPPRELLVK
jgi:hypothetical protein